jgi:ribonuclease HI
LETIITQINRPHAITQHNSLKIKPNKPNFDYQNNAASKIVSNYAQIGHKIPSHIRRVQFDLLHNALPTHRRTKKIKFNSPPPIVYNPGHLDITQCPLCQDGEDSTQHLFADCTVANLALRTTAHAHLENPNLQYSIPLALLATELTKTDTNLLILLNAAIWFTRINILRTLNTLSPLQQVLSRFYQLTAQYFPTLSKPSDKPNQNPNNTKRTNKKRKRKELALKMQDIIAAVPNDNMNILAYTDGSRMGDHDYCGAGALLRYDGDIHTASSALGMSSNNVGELYALGIVIDIANTLTTPPDTTPHIHIFTDSKWAFNAVSGAWKTNTNSRLVKTVRAKFKAYGLEHITVHYVPSHENIPGNDAADVLAKRGAKRSETHQFITHLDIMNLYDNNFLYPKCTATTTHPIDSDLFNYCDYI